MECPATVYDVSSEGSLLDQQFQALKSAATSNPFPSYGERKQNLKKLKHQLQRYQDVIAATISEDFGQRAHVESKIIDVMGPVLEINHALKMLKRWMKPSRRHAELLFLSNSIKVRYQPKGVVAIICPWNFPLYLSLGPLIASLATGNRAMIKMPANCPLTAQLLTQMLAEVFPQDLVCVVPGNHPQAMEISTLPFDHIVFTGSANVGKVIMANAAKNLTPVTLELGGKSPAVVTQNYPLVDAARRIMHGKLLNAGQICVSPDYALVPRDQITAFVEAAKSAALKMRPPESGGAGYTGLVDDKQEARFLRLIEDARSKGAEIIACGEKGPNRQYPVHLVTGVTPDMKIAQDEIFGPLLPIFPYGGVVEAAQHIVKGPRPLACYIFSHDNAEREYLLKNTHSGGVSVNDWGWHAFNHDAPFGGVGHSGTGSYHGEEGFRELSHAKTVFHRQRFFPTQLFYPPYENFVQKLTLKLFLNKPDPAAKFNRS